MKPTQAVPIKCFCSGFFLNMRYSYYFKLLLCCFPPLPIHFNKFRISDLGNWSNRFEGEEKGPFLLAKRLTNQVHSIKCPEGI